MTSEPSASSEAKRPRARRRGMAARRRQLVAEEREGERAKTICANLVDEVRLRFTGANSQLHLCHTVTDSCAAAYARAVA